MLCRQSSPGGWRGRRWSGSASWTTWRRTSLLPTKPTCARSAAPCSTCVHLACLPVRCALLNLCPLACLPVCCILLYLCPFACNFASTSSPSQHHHHQHDHHCHQGCKKAKLMLKCNSGAASNPAAEVPEPCYSTLLAPAICHSNVGVTTVSLTAQPCDHVDSGSGYSSLLMQLLGTTALVMSKGFYCSCKRAVLFTSPVPAFTLPMQLT